jgi:hypothetical protein
MIRILIADSQDVVRSGLRRIIEAEWLIVTYPRVELPGYRRQNEPLIMPQLAAASYLERLLSCGSHAPQNGGLIPPQGH